MANIAASTVVTMSSVGPARASEPANDVLVVRWLQCASVLTGARVPAALTALLCTVVDGAAALRNSTYT